MKQIILSIITLFAFITTVNAQDNPVNKGWGFGFQLNQYQRDFGMGLTATSPFIVHNSLALRARGNFMFYEHPEHGTTTWTPYSNASLGVVGVGGYIANFMRLYGEGGVIFLFPAADFSSESFQIGGYGLFGFEFFMTPMTNYFVEIGGVGTGAVADKVENEPIYSNGLLISTGFRIQLK
jgi:hypothetical protein